MSQNQNQFFFENSIFSNETLLSYGQEDKVQEDKGLLLYNETLFSYGQEDKGQEDKGSLLGNETLFSYGQEDKGQEDKGSLLDNQNLSSYSQEEIENSQDIINKTCPISHRQMYQWKLHPEMEMLVLYVNFILRMSKDYHFQRSKLIDFILNTSMYKNYEIVPTRQQLFSKFNNIRCNTIQYLHSKYISLKNTIPHTQELIEDELKKSAYKNVFFNSDNSKKNFFFDLLKVVPAIDRFRTTEEEREKARKLKLKRKKRRKKEEIKDDDFEWIESMNENSFILLINGKVDLQIPKESIKGLNYCMHHNTLKIISKLQPYFNDAISLFGSKNLGDKGWAFSFLDNTLICLFNDDNIIKVKEKHIIGLYKLFSFIRFDRMHEDSEDDEL